VRSHRRTRRRRGRCRSKRRVRAGWPQGSHRSDWRIDRARKRLRERHDTDRRAATRWHANYLAGRTLGSRPGTPPCGCRRTRFLERPAGREITLEIVGPRIVSEGNQRVGELAKRISMRRCELLGHEPTIAFRDLDVDKGSGQLDYRPAGICDERAGPAGPFGSLKTPLGLRARGDGRTRRALHSVCSAARPRRSAGRGACGGHPSRFPRVAPHCRRHR
jgi:hypothetical protein